MTKWHLIWTLLLFISFLYIVFWAFSASRKEDFNEAANLPLEDELELTDHLEQNTAKQENSHE